ncbi:MAG: hypothetical protein ABIN91_15485 [Mucilaginibacter sp.]|uniref:hypothetical protein n=1 Tax=Mucilaginibacter sp. TaxID=1882438 RepID=UPI0032672FB3
MKPVYFIICFTLLTCGAQAQNVVNIDSISRLIRNENINKINAEENYLLSNKLETETNRADRATDIANQLRTDNYYLWLEMNYYGLIKDIELWNTADPKGTFIKTLKDVKLETAQTTIKKITVKVSPYGKKPATLSDMLKNTASFKKLYPETSKLLTNHKLVFDSTIAITDSSVRMQILRINIPPLVSYAPTLSEKRKKADLYIDIIMKLSNTDELREYTLDAYKSFENSEVPDHNIDRILECRVKYLKALKKIYEKEI